MSNLFAQFKRLLPDQPLQAGVVQSVDGGIAVVEMPDGGLLQARGTADVGETVFVRDGVIEGIGPSLTPEVIVV